MWVGGRRRRRRRHRIPPHCDSSAPSYSVNSTEVNRVRTMSTSTIRRTSTYNYHICSFKYWILLASSIFLAVITQNMASGDGLMLPAWRAQHSATGMARNIRLLPCVSRRTGETGLCMFAYSCAKANGTHLGTCIDRFYFGSCCKLSPNSDPEVAEPLNTNFLNKEDVSSITKRPAFLPNFSAISSTYPPTSVLPSSLADLFTSSTTFIKTTGSGSSTSTSGSSNTIKPTSMHTISSLSFETIPITSRTPLVNVTLSQSYSTPLSHVTTSPLIYSTTVSTVFQGSSSRPAGVSSSTTGYSKPVTKPTPKPNKTKPSVTGKPGSSKPKPTKLPPKPGIAANTAFPNRTTTFTATTGLSSSSSSSSSTYFVDTTVPTRLPSRPSTQSVPTPITLFTTSKRPSKPTKTPSTVVYTTTTSAPPSSYVKIPVSTVGHSKPTTSIPSTVSSHYPSSNTDNFFSRINTTASSSTSMVTERPLRPWQTSSIISWTSANPSSSTSSSSTYTTSASSTVSQPSLVTWTTIEEIPAVILPDRTKPTSMVKPSGKPQVTRPSFFPTFSKPISSAEKTTSRPDLFKPASKPDAEHTTRVPTTSPSWVEVSVTTHAPTASASFTSSEPSEDITVNVISHTTAKPSTSLTIPVSSPLPLQTTSSPSIDPSGVVNMSDYRDVCGRRLFPTARIVGGEKATFGKWPWQISLRQWRTSTYLHKCGAALFNENWAVTAAHCVENVSPSDLLLRLGEHDLAVEDEPYGYQERRVPFVASHPQFDPRTFEYDLALLRFDEPVKFQPNIIPICVPEDDTNFVGSEAFVTGWGRLYEDGPLPSVLQEVSVPVINNSVCENMYQAAGYIEHIPNIFICAGWKKGGFDSCEGDSGGPMVIQRPDKRWLLAGIISWGIGCAEPNQPGVYTRISEFREWINQILQY